MFLAPTPSPLIRSPSAARLRLGISPNPSSSSSPLHACRRSSFSPPASSFPSTPSVPSLSPLTNRRTFLSSAAFTGNLCSTFAEGTCLSSDCIDGKYSSVTTASSAARQVVGNSSGRLIAVAAPLKLAVLLGLPFEHHSRILEYPPLQKNNRASPANHRTARRCLIFSDSGHESSAHAAREFLTSKRRRVSRLCQCHGREIPHDLLHKMILTANDVDGSEKVIDKDEMHSNCSSKILTVPTVLTLGRVAAIPALVVAFYSNECWATTAVACIFILAAITDWLDGFLARKMGSNSSFGAFLDPVADKLMVATTLVLLCTEPLEVSWASSSPWLIPIPSTAIIGREIMMSAVREWAASQGGDLQAAVAVNRIGKWKTAFQMVSLTILLATRTLSQNNSMSQLVAAGVSLLYISSGLALWSLVVYMKSIWGALTT